MKGGQHREKSPLIQSKRGDAADLQQETRTDGFLPGKLPTTTTSANLAARTAKPHGAA